MQNITRVWSGAQVAAVVAALVLSASEATAGALTVSEGDTIVFTFDFTNISGARAPYPDVRIHTGVDLASIDSGSDHCRYTLYRDGNGVDPDSSIVACGIDSFESANEESGWLDGILSFALTVVSGEITLDPHAIAFSAFGANGEPITPWVIPRIWIVAEPLPVALMLMLAAAFMIARGRARSTSG